METNLTPHSEPNPAAGADPAASRTPEMTEKPEAIETPEAPETIEAPETPERSELPAAANKPFPTFGDLLALLGIVLGSLIVVGLLLKLVAGLAGVQLVEPEDPAQVPAWQETFGRFTCICYLASMSIALLGVLLYRRKRGGTGPVVSFSFARLNPMMLLWSFIFLFSVGIVIEPLLDKLPDANLPIGTGIWTLVMTVLFAPLFEELLCRGVVLGSLRQRYGVVTALLGSSLFFGVIHLSPALVINACIMGLILGYIYLQTDSIWSSILLHAANNLVAWLLLTYGGQQRLLIDWIRLGVGEKHLWLYWVLIYIGALGIAGFSAWKAWKAIRQMKTAEKIGAAA